MLVQFFAVDVTTNVKYSLSFNIGWRPKMKSLYERFTDEEFSRIKKAKGKLTWKEFILQCSERRELD